MASLINSLLNDAGGNLARPTKFKAIISFPSSMKSLVDSKNYNVLCESVSLPAIKNEVIEIGYRGHKIPIPGRSDYEKTVSLTFHLDEAQQIRTDFATWIEGIDAFYINPSVVAKEMLLKESKDETFGQLVIMGLNWNDNPVVTYKFEGLFPTSISGIEFNGSTQSSILTLPVDFAFTKFSYMMNENNNAQLLDKILNDVIDGIRDGANAIVQAGLDRLNTEFELNSPGLEDEDDNPSGKEPTELGSDSQSQTLVPTINNKLLKKYNDFSSSSKDSSNLFGGN